MYVETVPNRNSPPAILLREGWREGKRVRKRTLANLSDWPPAKIETLRRLLKNQPLVSPEKAFDIVRSKPHGHVAAVLGSLRKLGLDRIIAATSCPERERVLALICARVLAPVSKVATARGLAEATARDSLAETLELGEVDEDDLYAAMDWLLERRGRSKGVWPGGILGTAPWRSMTSPRSIWKAAVVRWPGTAIPATASAASFRSSSGCCATATVVGWRWRCSRATPPMP